MVAGGDDVAVLHDARCSAYLHVAVFDAFNFIDDGDFFKRHGFPFKVSPGSPAGVVGN